MKLIQKLNVWSFARFQALLFLLIGFLAGICYAFGGLIIDSLVTLQYIKSPDTPGLSIGTLLAFGAIIGMPIIFGIAGFLLGIVEAVLFNIYAKFFGGIKVNF